MTYGDKLDAVFIESLEQEFVIQLNEANFIDQINIDKQ